MQSYGSMLAGEPLSILFGCIICFKKRTRLCVTVQEHMFLLGGCSPKSVDVAFLTLDAVCLVISCGLGPTLGDQNFQLSMHFLNLDSAPPCIYMYPLPNGARTVRMPQACSAPHGILQ